MIKKLYIICIIFFLFSCDRSKEKISAKMEHIIIEESYENQSITFIVTLFNDSNKDLVLFSNSILQDYDYQNSGFFIQFDNFKTPVGGLIPEDNLIHLKANSKENFLFTYSNYSLNLWKKISHDSIRESLTEIANKSTLFYSFNLSDASNRENIYKKHFYIKKTNPKIEYVKKFQIKDALDLVNSEQTNIYKGN